MPCWLSWCRRRSTLRWKPLEQMSHPNGLKPVCFLLWVIRLELWLNALPHTWHLWGFSPAKAHTTTTTTKTVRDLHHQILDHFQIICVKKLQFPICCFWRIRFVSRTKNVGKCFYQKVQVCINIYGWRIVSLFRFVKHLSATNVGSIEFLSQSSAWSRKTRYANPQRICLSFFFWFISTYITPRNNSCMLHLVSRWLQQEEQWTISLCISASIIKNMATCCRPLCKLWLTGVNVRVFLHVWLLMEPLAAVLAGVRPRVRVDEQVCGESGGALECFAAHLALKAFFLIKEKRAKRVTHVSTHEQDVRKVKLQSSFLALKTAADKVVSWCFRSYHMIFISRRSLSSCHRVVDVQIYIIFLSTHNMEIWTCKFRTTWQIVCWGRSGDMIESSRTATTLSLISYTL